MGSALKRLVLGARARTAVRFARRHERQIGWIFGSPRSGSTWLLQMLDRLDGTVCVNEPQIGGYLGPFLSDVPSFDASALDEDTFTLRRIQQDDPHQFFNRRHERTWRRGLRRLLDERFVAQLADRHRGRLSKGRLVVKEPNGSQSADIVMGAQPDAALVFLLRDGRDVVDSELAANLPGSWVTKAFPGATGVSDDERLWFVEQAAYKWRWRTKVVTDAYEAHDGPKVRLRYEDLVDDPVRWLGVVADTLGLDTDESAIESAVEATAIGRIDPARRGPREFVRSATPGGWRENLTLEEQKVLGDVLDDRLEALGYEVPSVA